MTLEIKWEKIHAKYLKLLKELHEITEKKDKLIERELDLNRILEILHDPLSTESEKDRIKYSEERYYNLKKQKPLKDQYDKIILALRDLRLSYESVPPIFEKLTKLYRKDILK